MLYRLKPEACGNYLATNLQWSADAFNKVKGCIPQLQNLETGINECKLDWSSDFSVLLEFTSWEAVDIFINLPLVKKALDFMTKISSEQRVIEFLA